MLKIAYYKKQNLETSPYVFSPYKVINIVGKLLLSSVFEIAKF